ncbi:MAG: flagellar basal body rod protein FlgB [Treponema sp.]|nr:flagellar basal body rod protein FlgB [Treponema sp.]
MNIDNDFSRTIDMVHRAMDARSMRQDIIANNLANAETPGFKRSELAFESQLKRALDAHKQKPALELAVTNPGHIGNRAEQNFRDVTPRRVLDFTSSSQNNGNNVDMEQELMGYVQNLLMYSLLAQAETFEFSQVNSVLRG